MRTVLQKIAFLALPLAVLVVSACSGHHQSYHDRYAWHEGDYDRGSSVDRYDERGSYDGEGRYTSGGRYDGGNRGFGFRWW